MPLLLLLMMMPLIPLMPLLLLLLLLVPLLLLPLLLLAAAVTSHSKPTPKAFNFKLSPSNADVLQALRLGFVATANNHVLDYGQPGLKETNQVNEPDIKP
jgi:hypothetical protein